MPAAKKLAEFEQFYFDHHWNVLSLPTLAEKLNRPEKFLKKLIDKKKQESPTSITPIVESQSPPEQPVNQEIKAPPPSAFNRLVGRQKNPDGTPKKNPPIVMTEGAAMVADEFLKTSNSGGLNPRLAQSVFKMRSE